ncbi:MAG: lytic transglycosylase domain-containing protein [Kineosporiaceae bacterium]|nr:lytic transglycosylase domain-containing protein [Aeromicrobium sp.]
MRALHAVLAALQCAALLAIAGWGAALWATSAQAKSTTPSYARAEVGPQPVALPETTVVAPVAGSVAASVVAPAVSNSARIDPSWLDTVSLNTGIPRIALAAYAGAATVLAESSPQCHLGWNTLAAIGHIESDDGRHGGAILSDNGYSSVPIIGPRLDGGAFAGIHDSDGGVWDGDSVWDHAVGPFQFIPQTWRTWGADGNGDGQANPNQLDDAALTAARYLCHAGDMSTVDGWRRAIFSYNHSESYVDDVAKVANSYRS